MSLTYLWNTEAAGVANLAAAERAGLLREAGVAGAAIDVDGAGAPQQVRLWLAALERYGLAPVAVRAQVNVAQERLAPWLPEVVAALSGRQTLLELRMISTAAHDAPSAPRADARAAALLRQMLALAAGLRVSLAPAAGYWLHRVEDAVRLGMRVNQPGLGLSWGLLDWLQTDGQTLEAKLQLALPRMWNLRLCGAQRDIAGNWQPRALGGGAFDVASLAVQLARLGYTGPVGLWVDPAAGDAAARQAVGSWQTLLSRDRGAAPPLR